MKVKDIGMKMWMDDNYAWHETVEVVVEHDPIADILTQEQRDSVELHLNSIRDTIMDTFKGWQRGDEIAKKAEPKKEEKETEPDTGGYDPETHKWLYCPTCRRMDKLEHSTRADPNRKYFACYDCRIYLNADGSIKEMAPRRE